MTTRMRKGFQMRSSYTFGKALGSANSDTSTVSPFFDSARVELRPADVQPYACLHHVAEFHGAARVAAGQQAGGDCDRQLEFVRHVQISTGQPYRPGFGTVDGQNFTGTPSQSATMTWVGPAGCADPNNCTLAQQFARPGTGARHGRHREPVLGQSGGQHV